MGEFVIHVRHNCIMHAARGLIRRLGTVPFGTVTCASHMWSCDRKVLLLLLELQKTTAHRPQAVRVVSQADALAVGVLLQHTPHRPPKMRASEPSDAQYNDNLHKCTGVSRHDSFAEHQTTLKQGTAPCHGCLLVSIDSARSHAHPACS